MTTKQQTLREQIADIMGIHCNYGCDDKDEALNRMVDLFQKTMEDKVIGEEEKVSKEHAMSEIIRNELRRKQFRALQSIISGEKISS